MAETVLVTGGAGFIGSRLARLALMAGWHVRIVDVLLPQVHGDTPQVPAWMTAECDVRLGDVRDAALMEAAVQGVDLVVHLAAETGTGQSMYAVKRYADVNVSGTAVLLEALQRATTRSRRLIVASSRAVYGEGQYRCRECDVVYPPLRDPRRLARGEWEPPCPTCSGIIEAIATNEEAVTRPVSVYGTTKLAQELLASNYANAFDTSVVALRFQNVYGGGQSLVNPYTGILTHFFNSLRRGEAPRVFEDGLESRDFVHIDDVVSALMSAATVAASGYQVVNIGSGVRTTIHRLATAMCEAVGSRVAPVVVGEYRIGDIRHCVADLARARNLLGYEPEVGLSAGLAEFAAWADSQQRSTVSEASANRELAALGLLRSAHDS